MSQNIEHVSINLSSDVVSEHLSDYVTRVLCNNDYFIANILYRDEEMKITLEIHPVVLRVCALNTEDCSMTFEIGFRVAKRDFNDLDKDIYMHCYETVASIEHRILKHTVRIDGINLTQPIRM